MRIAEQALRVAAVASVLVLSSPATSAEEAYIVEMGSYPVRSGPGLSSPVLGRIKVGEKVEVLARSSGWAQIAAPEIKGWVVETGVGAEPPAILAAGPLQERVSALEAGLQGLEEEKRALLEENSRLSGKAADLEKEAGGLRSAAAAAPRRERLWTMGLGGALVILGWVAGFALSRRRGSPGRYRIE